MGQTIALDTSVFIYLIEEHPRYLSRVESILHAVESGKTLALFSCIGLIELLTGPKKKGRYDLAAQYQELVSSFPNLTLIGVSAHVIELSSDLRAEYGISTPDAIHVATAIAHKAEKFITNDKALKKIEEIKVEML